MKFILKKILFVLIFCVCSCSSSDQPIPKRKAEKRLQLSLLHDVNHVDPLLALDPDSSQVIAQLYPTLFQLDYVSKEPHFLPYLASDYPEWSKDKKSIKIHIRSDSGLSASDVIYSFKRMILPTPEHDQNLAWIQIGNLIAGLSDLKTELHDAIQNKNNDAKKETQRILGKEVPGLKALNPHQIKIDFIRPVPHAVALLSLPFASIVSENQMSNNPPLPPEHGPFVVSQRNPGTFLKLNRNPKYFPDLFPKPSDTKDRDGLKEFSKQMGKPVPLIDGIDFHIIPSAQERFKAFREKKLDLLSYGPEMLDPLENSEAVEKEIKISEVPRLKGNTIYFILINVSDSRLKNTKLRQGLARLMDREKIVKTLAKNHASPANSLFPSAISERLANRKPLFEFDIKKAQKELAPWKGQSFTLRFPGSDEWNRRAGELFVELFAKVDLKLKIQYETQVFGARGKADPLEMMFTGWTLDYSDAENIVQLLYSKIGPFFFPDSHFNNPEIDRLYLEYLNAVGSTKKTQLLEKMDAFLQSDLPVIPLFSRDYLELKQPWVKNRRPTETLGGQFKYVDLEDRNP